MWIRKTYVVRPGVNGDLVASHVLGNENVRVRDHAGTHDEECRAQVMVAQILKYLPIKTALDSQSRAAECIDSLRSCGKDLVQNQHVKSCMTYSRERGHHRN